MNVLARTTFDTFVLDPTLSRANVQRLKKKPDGKPRLVLAYLNVGEAEDYRSYWKKAWEKQPPEWLGASNAFWKGDHRVRHWHPDWQRLVYGTQQSLVGGLKRAFGELKSGAAPVETTARTERYMSSRVVLLGIFLGLFAWTGLARLVRGEFLTLREREFVDAARVAGASNRRIIFKHILPNAVGVIIVSVTLLMSGAILLETALSYLGFGVVFPDVSLGLLISQYQDAFQTRPWLFWWPGLIITIALSINFIGDGLRDAFDPRQKRRITRKDRERAKVAERA